MSCPFFYFNNIDELKKVMGWLSKNFDRQDVLVLQARDHTCSMSSVWRTKTTQDIGTFYDAINICTLCRPAS